MVIAATLARLPAFAPLGLDNVLRKGRLINVMVVPFKLSDASLVPSLPDAPEEKHSAKGGS